MGIGVAGTRVSACGPAIALGVDITNRQSVQVMLNQVIMTCGAIDDIIVTADIFVPPTKEGKIADDKWGLTFAVNVKGGYLYRFGRPG